MKKMIWIPLVLGITLGLLDLLSLGVHWVIRIANFGAIGPQETLVIISAALGGPLSGFVTNFLQELGMHIFLLKGDFPGQRLLEVSISIADFIAHTLALFSSSLLLQISVSTRQEGNYLLCWLDINYSYLLYLAAAAAIVPAQSSRSWPSSPPNISSGCPSRILDGRDNFHSHLDCSAEALPQTTMARRVTHSTTRRG